MNYEYPKSRRDDMIPANYATPSGLWMTESPNLQLFQPFGVSDTRPKDLRTTHHAPRNT